MPKDIIDKLNPFGPKKHFVKAAPRNKKHRHVKPVGGEDSPGSTFRDYRGVDGALEDANKGKKKD